MPLLPHMSDDAHDANNPTVGSVSHQSASDDTSAGLPEVLLHTVKVVEYQPGKKPQRLGRPRRHIASGGDTLKLADDNSLALLVTKFRVDDGPVEGPGSRGGDGKVKVPSGKVIELETKKRKRTVQAPLVFEEPTKRQRKLTKKVLEAHEANDTNEGTEAKKVKKEVKITLPPPPPVVNYGQVSRTGVVPRVENKLCRQLPGPVVPLHYDLYDDHFISKLAKEGVQTTIGGGWKVKQAPYAADIVYIIEFLNKFKDIVGIDCLAPQLFEKGLGLGLRSLKFANKFVSPDMQLVFLKLLALVLNKEKEVVSQAQAIGELKINLIAYGLAEEWKRTVMVVVDGQGEVLEVEEQRPPVVAQELVDPTHPEIHPGESPILYRHYIDYNPFEDPEFEAEGLVVLTPENRLIMLRMLVHWAMAQLDQIRQSINVKYLSFEMLGDKDTLYAARVVANGVQNCEETKREAEIKLGRRKPEDAEKYVDPLLNPLDYGLRLRLVESYVGDGGALFGRFYLSCMPDASTGGLALVKTMTEVWDHPDAKPQTRRRRALLFKLYVQDIHTMLEEAYSEDGVEFDENGKQVQLPPVKESLCTWYEVATNSQELAAFVHHLGEILGVESGNGANASDDGAEESGDGAEESDGGTDASGDGTDETTENKLESKENKSKVKQEQDKPTPAPRQKQQQTPLPVLCGLHAPLSHIYRYLKNVIPVLEYNELGEV